MDRTRPDPEYRRITHFSGQSFGAMLAFRQAASLVTDQTERDKILRHAEDFSHIYAAINDEMELLAAVARAVRADRTDKPWGPGVV